MMKMINDLANTVTLLFFFFFLEWMPFIKTHNWPVSKIQPLDHLQIKHNLKYIPTVTLPYTSNVSVHLEHLKMKIIT